MLFDSNFKSFHFILNLDFNFKYFNQKPIKANNKSNYLFINYILCICWM